MITQEKWDEIIHWLAEMQWQLLKDGMYGKSAFLNEIINELKKYERGE